MLNITSTASTHAIQSAVAMPRVLSDVSASRGNSFAQQGIRLSSGGDLGLQVFASKAQAPMSNIVIKQDKPMEAWHPAAAYGATGRFAVETGTNPVDLLAARLRHTHLATVNRSRHRSRLR
ncbi:hypothetical protein [Nocardia sp. NPDC127526]|uniref:hypothetical protein n=1 Tax=Nocardia sp. NPDC127526 TaxID=3345393 RepID=UPI00363FE696